MNFKVDDRVFADDGYFNGEGTIVCIDGDGWYGVELDNAFEEGHTLGDRCPAGHGRWYEEGDLRHLDEETIIDETRFLEVIS